MKMNSSSSDSSLGVPHKRAPPPLCQTYPTFPEIESCCNNYFYEKYLSMAATSNNIINSISVNIKKIDGVLHN